MSMANPKWAKYSESTRKTWGRELQFMARPDCLGALSLQNVRPSLVQAYFDGIADRPGKSVAGLAALQQLEAWAIVRDFLPRPITTGVEIAKSDAGHVPWTLEQVALAEAKARPDLARAVTLAANTGQRVSDLVRMQPNDIEIVSGIEGINVVQKKTRRQVWVPITSALAEAMRTWERRPGPFLTRLDGRAWESHALTNAWTYERDTNPELHPLGEAAVNGQNTNDGGLVLHGLRASACVTLKRAGASIPQIADVVGMSYGMVERYCRLSAQKENAVATVIALERTRREREIDMSKKFGG
jgi:integrase